MKRGAMSAFIFFALHALISAPAYAEIARFSETRAATAIMAVVLLTAFIMIGVVFWRERKNADRLSEEREQLRLSEQKYRLAMRQSARSVAQYDIDDDALTHDDKQLFALGMPRRIIGITRALTLAGLLDESAESELNALIERIRKGVSETSCILRINDKAGGYLWLQIYATAIIDERGRPLHAIVSYENITRRREAETAYEKWRSELEAMPMDKSAIFEWNLTRNELENAHGELRERFIQHGDFSMRLTDYATNRVDDEHKAEFAELMNRERLLGAFYGGKTGCELDFRERGAGDEGEWMRVSVRLAPYPDTDEIKAFVLISDIDEQKRAELAVKTRSELDPLTGALNRTAFEAEAEALIARTPEGTQHALMMLDIDDFKRVNDTFGHDAGDNTLVEITNQLRAVLRQGDLLGRMGGDEFIICLENMPYDAVIDKRAKLICAMLGMPIENGMNISVSVGIAVYPRDGKDFMTLYKNADLALYYRKQHAKNGFAFYNEDMKKTEDEPEATEVSSPGLRKRRMLIVDDDKMSCAMLAEIFKDAFLIDKAHDGRTALIKMRRFGAGIAVLLLDLYMPVMDGFTVMAHMRESPELRSIPIVAVSGADEQETTLKAIEAGASDFATKPIDPAIITMRVQSAISKAENARLRVQNSYLLLQGDEEQRYRDVLESSGTIVVEHDWVNNVFIYDQMIGRRLAGKYDNRMLWRVFLSDMVASAMDVKDMQGMAHALANDRNANRDGMNVMLKDISGEKRWFRMNMIKRTDGYNLTSKLLITFNDIHDEIMATDKLRFQAEHDELTGIYNRRAFIEKAGTMIQAARGGSYMLACMDVENFRIFNDMHGRAEGDRLLKWLATELQRTTLLCARLNADHFAALIANDSEKLAILTQQTSASALDFVHDFDLRLKFGLYVADNVETSAEVMLDNASLANRSIKGDYRRKLAFYSDELNEKMLLERELVSEMDSALVAGDFDICLQAQFDHSTGRLCGAEAMARWSHSERGMIMPGVFIPIFEKNGFIIKLDDYVRGRVCEALGRWLKQGYAPVPIAVNMSRIELYNPRLHEDMRSVIQKYDVPPKLLRIEITESAYVEDAEQLREAVTKLRELGFTIEMDDFGSGYSSLNSICELPVDVLKLDMLFINGADEGDRRGRVLRDVVSMARGLGLDVIAEGVENKEQADYLLSIGCPQMQGYYFGKPVSVDEFEEILRAEQEP